MDASNLGGEEFVFVSVCVFVCNPHALLQNDECLYALLYTGYGDIM